MRVCSCQQGLISALNVMPRSEGAKGTELGEEMTAGTNRVRGEPHEAISMQHRSAFTTVWCQHCLWETGKFSIQTQLLYDKDMLKYVR